MATHLLLLRQALRVILTIVSTQFPIGRQDNLVHPDNLSECVQAHRTSEVYVVKFKPEGHPEIARLDGLPSSGERPIGDARRIHTEKESFANQF
jgi:hypothetical protein